MYIYRQRERERERCEMTTPLPWENDEVACKYGLRAIDFAFMRIYDDLSEYLPGRGGGDKEIISKRFHEIKEATNPLGYGMGIEDKQVNPNAELQCWDNRRVYQKFMLIDLQDQLPRCLYDKLLTYPALQNYEIENWWYLGKGMRGKVVEYDKEPFGSRYFTLGEHLRLTEVDRTCALWIDFYPEN